MNPFLYSATSEQLRADQSVLLDDLVAGVNGPAFVQLVAGRSGAGKSTALKALPEAFPLAARVLEYRSLSLVSSARALMAAVAYEFGLRTGDKLARLGIRTSPSKPDQTVDDAWSEYDVAELIGEVLDAAENDRTCVLCLDHCEAVSLGDPEKLAILRGVARAASDRFRVIFAVRQDALGSVFDALEGRLRAAPKLLLAPGLTVEAAVAYAMQVLAGAGQNAREADVRFLVGALEQQDHVWPVALSAVLSELTEAGSSLLREAPKLEDPDIRSLIGRSLQRRLNTAPDGLVDECYWTLRAISRSRISGARPTEAVLVATSMTANAAELRKALTFMVDAKLVERDPQGGYALAHEAIAIGLSELQSTHGERTVDVLDMIETWQATGVLRKRALMPLVAVLGAETPLPLPALVLVAAAISRGIVGEFPEILSALKRRLAAFSPQDVREAVRLLASGAGQDTSDLDAALLFAGTPESVAAFLTSRSRTGAATEDRQAGLGRLLMFADAEGLGGAVEISSLGPDNAVLLSSVKAILRRDDVRLASDAADRLAGALSGSRPDLAIALAERFAPGTMPTIISAMLGDGSLRQRIAGLSWLARAADSPPLWAAAAKTRVIELASSPHPIERRRALGVLASSVSAELSLSRAFAREGDPMVREGVLEALTCAQPEAAQIIHAGLADGFDFVRESAVYALSRCGGTSTDFGAVLRPLLDDESLKVREAAIRVLTTHDQDVPIEDILRGLRMDSESLRLALLSAAAIHPVDQIELALADIALNTGLRPDLRSPAIMALGRRSTETAFLVIGEVLCEEQESILSAALTAAQLSGDNRHLSSIRRLSDHPVVSVRERAIYAVAELGTSTGVDVLLDALLDPEADIRLRAVHGLHRLSGDVYASEIRRHLRAEQDERILQAVAGYFSSDL